MPPPVSQQTASAPPSAPPAAQPTNQARPLPVPAVAPGVAFNELPTNLQSAILDGAQDGMNDRFDDMRLRLGMPPYSGEAPWAYNSSLHMAPAPNATPSAGGLPPNGAPTGVPPTGPPSGGTRAMPHRLDDENPGYLSFATEEGKKMRQPSF